MYGAIDVGTNSVRLLVAEIVDSKVKPLYRGLKTTRLGEGVQEKGRLQEGAIGRTVCALSEFAKVLTTFQLKQVRAVATSAARSAVNSYVLIKKAQELGLELSVISGDEEARLSFYGATSVHAGSVPPLVIDIGGGSTEFIHCSLGKIFSTSIEAGAVRATEGAWTANQIKKSLEPALKRAMLMPEKKLVGVGGTITSLAAIAQKLKTYDPSLIQGYSLSLDQVQNIWQELASLSLEQKRLVLGLRPDRADIILAGTQILLITMQELRTEQILVSESDLLDGIILELGRIFNP